MDEIITEEVPIPTNINFQDLRGIKYGRLKVLYFVGFEMDRSNNKNLPNWLCQCECGKKLNYVSCILQAGFALSCKQCNISNRPKLMLCKDCNKEKEFNSDNFYKRVQATYGLMTICKECYKKTTSKNGKAYRARLRINALHYYSKGDIKCECCGIRTLEFLALDHIEGEGNKERKKIGYGNFFLDLQKRGYPEGYRVLCSNCNFSRGAYGYCPCKNPEKAKEMEEWLLSNLTIKENEND